VQAISRDQPSGIDTCCVYPVIVLGYLVDTGIDSLNSESGRLGCQCFSEDGTPHTHAVLTAKRCLHVMGAIT
jgi:hypothetical protein